MPSLSRLRRVSLRVIVPLALAGWGYGYVRSDAARSPTVPSPTSTSPDQNAQVAREIARLKTEVSALRSGLDGILERAEGATARSPTGFAERSAGVAEPIVGGERQAQRAARLEPSVVSDHYRASFQEQPVEAGWSAREERDLTEYFASTAPKGIELERLECRSSLCRVDLRAETEDQLESFVHGFGEPPFDHGLFYEGGAEALTIVVYATREGHPLPQLLVEPSLEQP